VLEDSATFWGQGQAIQCCGGQQAAGPDDAPAGACCA
jgi:hypothetical protein